MTIATIARTNANTADLLVYEGETSNANTEAIARMASEQAVADYQAFKRDFEESHPELFVDGLTLNWAEYYSTGLYEYVEASPYDFMPEGVEFDRMHIFKAYGLLFEDPEW